MSDQDPPEENDGVFKKHALSLAEGVRPARPQPLGRAERTGRVREHGQGAKTPLAAFFNIPLKGE